MNRENEALVELIRDGANKNLRLYGPAYVLTNEGRHYLAGKEQETWKYELEHDMPVGGVVCPEDWEGLIFQSGDLAGGYTFTSGRYCGFGGHVPDQYVRLATDDDMEKYKTRLYPREWEAYKKEKSRAKIHDSKHHVTQHRPTKKSAIRKRCQPVRKCLHKKTAPVQGAVY